MRSLPPTPGLGEGCIRLEEAPHTRGMQSALGASVREKPEPGPGPRPQRETPEELTASRRGPDSS